MNLMKTIRHICRTAAYAAALSVTCLTTQAQSVASTRSHTSRSANPAGHDYQMPFGGKFYVGFDAGVAFQQNVTLRNSLGDSENISYNPGLRTDVQFGWQMTTDWAVELELGILGNQVKSSYVLGTEYWDVNFYQLPMMANVIYSHQLGRHWSLYAGGGIGPVFSYYENDWCDTTPSATSFGYQGLAGLKYHFNERYEMGVGYKFLDTTGYTVGSGVAYDGITPTDYKSDGNLSHSILLTFTWRF